MKKCPCASCPSYNECAKGKKELLYCLMGKSKCAYERNGCLCLGCPVAELKKFSGAYFCISGKAKPDA